VLPFILFTGMDADDRLFEGQREEFGEIITPAWVEPLPRESLRSYAQRMLEQTGVQGPCILGGASFGGVIAQEAAHLIEAKALFLIGSLRHPRELPLPMRVFRFLSCLPPERARLLMALAAMMAKPVVPRPTHRRMRKMAALESTFLRWASMQLLRWRPAPHSYDLPTFQIHGDADGTIPIRGVNPDAVVQGGDHIISYRRAAAVNAFIEKKLQDLKLMSRE